MATAITDANVSRTYIVHIILSLSLLVSAVFMMLQDTPDYKRSIQGEMHTVKLSLGDTPWNIVERKTNRRFKEHFYDNGVYEWIYSTFNPNTKDNQKGGVAAVYKEDDMVLYRFIDNSQLFAYQVFFRLSMLEYWAALTLPMGIAMILTGYYTWRRKMYQLGGASTGKGRIYMKVLWFVFISFLSLLFAPSFLASASVYAPAIFVLVASFAVSQYIANFSKLF